MIAINLLQLTCKFSLLDQIKNYDSIRILFDFFLFFLQDIKLITLALQLVSSHVRFPFNPEHTPVK